MQCKVPNYRDGLFLSVTETHPIICIGFLVSNNNKNNNKNNNNSLPSLDKSVVHSVEFSLIQLNPIYLNEFND